MQKILYTSRTMEDVIDLKGSTMMMLKMSIMKLMILNTVNQSWALAHFFEVRYPLPTQFFPMDR